MSSRRAAIRRERKQREKAMKSHSPVGELARATEQGKIDGRALSVFITSLYLHSDFGWGAKKIIGLIEKCNAEAVRFDNDGVMFTFEFYAKKIGEKLNAVDLHQIRKTSIIVEEIYNDNRNDFFLTGMSVLCTCLSSDYGYAINKSDTGRLDRLIEKCVKEYVNVLSGDMDIEGYCKRCKDEVGIDFK